MEERGRELSPSLTAAMMLCAQAMPTACHIKKALQQQQQPQHHHYHHEHHVASLWPTLSLVVVVVGGWVEWGVVDGRIWYRIYGKNLQEVKLMWLTLSLVCVSASCARSEASLRRTSNSSRASPATLDNT